MTKWNKNTLYMIWVVFQLDGMAIDNFIRKLERNRNTITERRMMKIHLLRNKTWTSCRQWKWEKFQVLFHTWIEQLKLVHILYEHKRRKRTKQLTSNEIGEKKVGTHPLYRYMFTMWHFKPLWFMGGIFNETVSSMSIVIWLGLPQMPINKNHLLMMSFDVLISTITSTMKMYRNINFRILSKIAIFTC